MGGDFDPAAFAAFLSVQPDLGTKWAPRFVRVTRRMPLTATNKVDKNGLRQERWECVDPVWWRQGRDLSYVPLTEEARSALRARFTEFGRTRLLV